MKLQRCAKADLKIMVEAPYTIVIAATPVCLRLWAGVLIPPELLNLVQWPAMAVTVFAAWLVASQRKFKRNWGFWMFLLSNLLWIAWAIFDRAYALVFLQICLAVMNIHGVRQTTKTQHSKS